MKPRIVIAGGTGFIGSELTSFLVSKGYSVSVLTRGNAKERGAVRFVRWNGNSLGKWENEIDGAAAVVNLAGRNINCRHTAANRAAILNSRVDSVHALHQAVERCQKPPPVFIQASAVGFYGNRGDHRCDEQTPPGDDFVAEVCQAWESAFEKARMPSTRKVLLRLGVVLAREQGALRPLSRLTRWFLGGHAGNGRQFISWIHIRDLLRVFEQVIERDDLDGVFNAVSPDPVTNAEFMRELRKALRRPWSPPVPKWAVRIGTWLIGTEASLALVSQRCVPKRFLERNFAFEFSNLHEALAEIFRSGKNCHSERSTADDG
jgi:uncharacterized protein